MTVANVRVLIVGAGGHAAVVADTLLRLHDAGTQVEPVGLLDDDIAKHRSRVQGLSVLGDLAELSRVPHDALVIAIGDNRLRCALSQRLLSNGERFFVARHPASVIAPDVRIDPGTVICAGVVVSPACEIGPGVILNTACSIDHHNIIGGYAHIGPGARLGGAVAVGDEALIGIGAVVLPSRRIGSRAVVGAGAVVISDVPDDAIVTGVPARVRSSY